MDRRQRKTREAIFSAFTELLSEKEFPQITVGEIIARADIGRATFYAHFETKDFLLKELCEELFCHLFDREKYDKNGHRHIFDCSNTGSVFEHLFQHIAKNDNNLLLLLRSQNNDLFFGYFQRNLEDLIEKHLTLFEGMRKQGIPDAFWKNHVVAVFIETLRWWIGNGMKESPETITAYYFAVV